MRVAQGKMTIRKWGHLDWEWICRLPGCRSPWRSQFRLTHFRTALYLAEKHVREWHR